MFSEAYKNLCELHKEKLREEWEPKFGDLVIDCERVAVVTGVEGDDICVDYRDYGAAWCDRKDVIPLPMPRQLIRMLEERGHEKWQITNTPLDPCSVEAGTVFTEGPDPETALLKALMEVMKDDTTLP